MSDQHQSPSPAAAAAGPAAAATAPATASVLLAAMADGIGDLTFATPEWVSAARDALTAAAARHAEGLGDLGTFTLCEVAHNPPAFLHLEGALAWHARFDGAHVEVGTGELPAGDCDLKVQGDHAVMSNLARLQHHGKDPLLVAAAQARLQKIGRWQMDGAHPEHRVLRVVLRSLHDTMAARTMPRFVWMTPEWTQIARHIVSTRAKMPEYADRIKDEEYRFAEVFTQTPRFAFPDGAASGFWVVCDHGEVTVGFAALPQEYGSPDYLNQLLYTPVVPVGRTVNAAMTDADKAEATAYSDAAFAVDVGEGNLPIRQSDPANNKPFPPGLGAVDQHRLVLAGMAARAGGKDHRVTSPHRMVDRVLEIRQHGRHSHLIELAALVRVADHRERVVRPARESPYQACCGVAVCADHENLHGVPAS